MSIIELNDVSKDYGKGRGIFDIDLSLRQGEIYGYVGTNGSGKTTTIRTIMGFIRPDKGNVSVLGMDSWKNRSEIMQNISYVPGEIEFPSFKTGLDFLRYQAGFLKLKDEAYMNSLIEKLGLDPTANLKRMSKGMKQKTALVAALMGDKDILILDEPTTGLDPLMRNVFLELLREEKNRGKTILMSTHIYEEIEAICDRVSLIHNGRIVSTENVFEIMKGGGRNLKIYFDALDDLNKFKGIWKRPEYNDKNVSDDMRQADANQVNVMNMHENPAQCCLELNIKREAIGKLMHALDGLDVRQIREEHMTLEKHFREVLRNDN